MRFVWKWLDIKSNRSRSRFHKAAVFFFKKRSAKIVSCGSTGHPQNAENLRVNAGDYEICGPLVFENVETVPTQVNSSKNIWSKSFLKTIKGVWFLTKSYSFMSLWYLMISYCTQFMYIRNVSARRVRRSLIWS